MENTPVTPPPHQGKNVKRIREMLGIKQEKLALDLGISQQAISQLEQKEALDADLLEKVAAALKVPAEAIKKFTDESVVNYFNTFNDSSVNYGSNHMCTVNINNPDLIPGASAERQQLYELTIRMGELLKEFKEEWKKAQ